MAQASISELMDLRGKTAIVTGGAVGIGLGIVTRLAEAGASVVIADISADEATKAANQLQAEGRTVHAITIDVSSGADVDRLIRETVEVFGSVDILVNNAGIYPNIPILKLAEKDYDRIMDINLKGVYLCTRAAAEQMVAQGTGGRIINITSIDALHPSMVGLATYDASKHGVWGFTKNAALELAEHKIWVNAVAPGGIVTPGVARLGAGQSASSTEEQKGRVAAFMQKIPMHRMGEPDEIGKVVLFLATDMASYMTGSQIVVDGGALLS